MIWTIPAPAAVWPVTLALAILLAHATPAVAVPEAPSKPRPNFVVILIDDLGWVDLSCQGSRFMATPRIDRMASQGLRFTQAYAACAVCSPSRAALLTGRYPARIGVTDWIRARFQRPGRNTPQAAPSGYVGGASNKLLCPPNPFWMELSELTLAEVLQEAGYATCHIGKWHLGDDAWYPTHQGFDINLGGCDFGQPPSYFDPYRNRALPDGIPTLAPRREGEYLTDREADEAVAFIRQHREQPFFLYLATYAVHTPLEAKPELRAKYQAKPKTQQRNATYAAMVDSVDQLVGSVLDELDAAGVAGRTLVVFTSDNGGLLGSTDNAPLRAGKGYPYEGGIRVPFIARWPERVPAGRTSDEPVCGIDIFPTILAAAGLESPHDRAIDGISLWDSFRSPDQRWAERPLFWHFPHYRSPEIRPYSIVRSGGWKLIKFYEGPVWELYNLDMDPGEQHDLAAAQPERVQVLDRLLSEHLQAVGARLPRKNPAYGAEASREH